MSEEKDMDILDELKTFPKPELEKNVKNQMHLYLEDYSTKYHKRKRWEIKMKRTFIGAITAVTILTLSFISYNSFFGKDKYYDQSASPGEEKEYKEDSTGDKENNVDQPLDPIDLKLDTHQVAIGELYFEIPMDKKSVFIDRRVEGDYTLVDIRDKKTNELLYRYGESLENKKEKIVYREVQTDDGKIKINAFLDVDVNSNKINNIKDTSIEVVSSEFPFDNPFSDGLSRSGKFPSEKITVIGRGGFWKKKGTEGYSVEFYEGFAVGVIPKD